MAGPQTQAAGPTAGLDEASAVKGMVGTRGRGASGAGTGSAAAGLTGDSCPRPRSAQSRAGGGDRGPLPPARPMNPHPGQRRPPRRRVSTRRGPRRQGLTCRSAREIPTVSKNCSTKDTRAPSTAGLLGPRGSWTGRREGSLGAGPPGGGARAPAGSLGCRPQGRGLSIPLGAEPQGGDGGGSGWRRGGPRDRWGPHVASSPISHHKLGFHKFMRQQERLMLLCPHTRPSCGPQTRGTATSSGRWVTWGWQGDVCSTLQTNTASGALPPRPPSALCSRDG